MKTKTPIRILAAAVVLALVGVFALGVHAGDYDKSKMAKQDIVAIAASNPDFSTLVTALKAAGLVEALQGDGPFTVFAPTNAAFEKLPAGTLDSLLADKEALTKVLTYHVVSGKVTAEQVVNVDSATTLQGGAVPVQAKGGNVMVGGAQVVKADVMATNGVIHVIDTVLIPSE